jgi:oligopeptidase A
MKNPLLSFGRGLPDYSAIQPEHIQPAIQELLKEAQLAVEHSLAPITPALGRA